MKTLFAGLLVTTPLLALILFFSLFQTERNTAEMKVIEATAEVKEQKFMDDWTDGWNGIGDPDDRSKVLKQRSERLDGLKAEADKAKVRRDHLDNFLEEATDDMESAIKEESARLEKEGLSKKKVHQEAKQ